MKIITRKQQDEAISLARETYKIVYKKILADSLEDGTMDAIAENLVGIISIVGSIKDLKREIVRGI
jgi:hypothetical protein